MNQDNTAILTIPSGKTNVYLLIRDGSAILIDTGVKGKQNGIWLGLEKYGLKPENLSLIILTHTHYDHCGNVKLLKESTRAPLLVHQKEAENLRSGFASLPDGTFFLSKCLVELGRRLETKIGKYEPAEPDITVEDHYDLSNYGIPGYIMSTPGHTAGSVSVILEQGDAFIGDTAFHLPFVGIYPPFANDQETLIRSWEKLLDTDCRNFYPGHGSAISRKQLTASYRKRT